MFFPCATLERESPPPPPFPFKLGGVPLTGTLLSPRIPQGHPAPNPIHSLAITGASAPWEGQGLPRAPLGAVSYSVTLGGARTPELSRRRKAEQEAMAYSDLAQLLGVRGSPLMTRQAYWPSSLPQYGQGYGAVLRVLNGLEVCERTRACERF